MYRDDLFELLCFYGSDVQLLEPAALRTEFVSRLRMLSELCRKHENNSQTAAEKA
ncbi:hypothetical protein RQN30_01110 [Arcanobacterium hippocoleae]